MQNLSDLPELDAQLLGAKNGSQLSSIYIATFARTLLSWAYTLNKHIRPELQTASNPAKAATIQVSDHAYLNALNLEPGVPSSSDVVVVGGGIHSLIYAIHTCLRSQSLFAADPSIRVPSITVLERLSSPGYKIGESTLTTFGVWLKSIALDTSLLWRLFGAKDGLAFYYLPSDGSWEGVTSFCANGPRGDFVATLQIERKISELLLTLYAQRIGVKVLHGVDVDVAATQIASNATGSNLDRGSNITTGYRCPDASFAGSKSTETGTVKLKTGTEIETRMLVDATGRFRRFASKESHAKRFAGFNTDSFWAYFEMVGDESDLPFEHYESCHTNHICLAEGWAWIIRLPTWEGSPIPNLVRMVNHLLDLNALKAPSDAYPSSHELAERFGCKFRWVTSIGYALRDDVVYPTRETLETFGAIEAERKFNWITAKYPRMQAFMNRHRLVRNLYGDNKTWFIRKQLSYASPTVAGLSTRTDGSDGMAWAAIGDAAGFTNPLYSPGINCNMATSVKLAEKTSILLSSSDRQAKMTILQGYNDFCVQRVPNLFRMNAFNYVLMRSPRTGPLGPLWQYLSGTGNSHWRRQAEFVSVDRVAEFVTSWEWGAQHPEYIAFAERAISLLSGLPCEMQPDDATIEEVLRISGEMMAKAVQGGKYTNRWAGLLRWYDDQLNFDGEKVSRDKLATRCEGCGNWRMLTGTARKCCICGNICEEIEIVRYN